MPKKQQDKKHVTVYLDASDIALLEAERAKAEKKNGYKLSNAQIIRGLIRTHLKKGK